MSKRCFLRFFAILLAICAGLVLALWQGAPQAVWRSDASMMTSAIAALFAVTLARMGVASWRAETGRRTPPLVLNASNDAPVTPDLRRARGEVRQTIEFGHLAVRLAVMFGFIGTAIGLSLQAHALATEGAASLGALSTSLFTTATGGVAAALIEILTFNLEAGADA